MALMTTMTSRLLLSVAIFGVLHIGAVRGFRSSDTDESFEDELQDASLTLDFSSESSIGAQMSMLVSASSKFLASAEMQAELAQVSQLPLARSLAEKGLSIEHRFRLFALKHAIHQGHGLHEASLLQEETKAAAADAEVAAHNFTRDHEEWFWGKKKTTPPPPPPQSAPPQVQLSQTDAQGQQDTVDIDFAAISAIQASCSDMDMEELLSEMDIVVVPGSKRETYIKAALRNYCKLSGSAKMEADSSKKGITSLDVIKGHDLEPAGSGAQPTVSSSISGVGKTAEDKRMWHLAQALKPLKWLGLDTQPMMPDHVKSIKEVFKETALTNGNLQSILHEIQHAKEVDWLNARKGSFGRHLTRFVGKAWNKIKTFAGNVGKFFKNTWNSFKSFLRKSEKKCNADTEATAKKGAKAAGLQTGKMSDSQAAAMGKKMSRMKKGQLEKESSKVENALNKVEEDASEGMMDEHTLQEKLDRAKSKSQNLEKELQENQDDEDTLEDSVQDLEQTEKDVGALENDICKQQTKSTMQKLKEFFIKTKKAFVAAKKTPAPTLGVRGGGAGAGPGSAGLEEVVDFRNREIAQFVWGASFIGTSNTGASLGGYAGMGWKGYKENWTLEEGYVTALYISQGIAPSFFGMSVSAGVTYCTDADNSGPGPWVPEPHGINGLLLGWSVGASLSNVVMPLKWDYGAAYYWMLNSECYDGLADLIKHIWLPVCKNCFAGSEKINVGLLRAGIHASSFFPLSESIFSVLAALYDAFIREPGHEPRCSLKSTNHRGNATLFAVQAAQQLQENSKLIEQIEAEVNDLSDITSNANTMNDQLSESQELFDFRKNIQKHIASCPPTPPTLVRTDSYLLFKNTPDTDMRALCDTYQLDSNCKGLNPWARTKRISFYVNLRDGFLGQAELHIFEGKLQQAISSSPLVALVGSWLDQCNGKERCVSGISLARGLQQQLNKKDLGKLCKAMMVKCKSFNFPGAPLIDKEMMSFKIAVAAGGGSVSVSNLDNPFGICSTNRDCPLPNQVCAKETVHGYYKRCQCKKNFCYDASTEMVQGKTFQKETCAPYKQDISELITQTRRALVINKIKIGQQMSKLKGLSKEIK
eukprot:TRINITY_DN48511_c0_g1_i1.p1 TRINITY_DN48511_c0_g1~~TRINITY_DN48511_c0_g1_i1.p1  ORF type:complete len:1098 (-),score=250.03 TRINITY_DN48511_c0_g1_i1:109-3402(-)